ncbi:hypothetical protein BK147_09340 [Paenibacillus sp. FSL R7-0337]|nr:hypothetical protein BK147_09340 [Paenibacillus sp. FSL R7-0337]
MLANSEIRSSIRNHLKELRSQVSSNHKQSFSLDRVLFTEQRTGYLHGKIVDRLVLFLRGTGCTHAIENGGCTFCGFYNATNLGEKIEDKDYIEQLTNTIETFNGTFDQFPIVCLYNDGSLLNEREISFNAVMQMFGILNGQQGIQKIVIESKIEDINEQQLKKLISITDKEIEIAVGFESSNPLIRDLCINKSFDNKVFERKWRIAQQYNVSIVPILMLKPPFLTEREAVLDYIESLKYLEPFHLTKIDLELPTVESHTLVHDLWKNGQYRSAWFWSLLEILRSREEMGLTTRLFIGPPSYSVSSIAHTGNCEKCDQQFLHAIHHYNCYGELSRFEEITCSCKKKWAEEYYAEEKEDLLTRIKGMMAEIKFAQHRNERSQEQQMNAKATL